MRRPARPPASSQTRRFRQPGEGDERLLILFAPARCRTPPDSNASWASLVREEPNHACRPLVDPL